MLILGDCLQEMPKLPDKSIDMVLCDLPYGTTACKWDEIIPFEPMWEQYNRLCKDNAAIVLFASQPFAANLIVSNLQMFRYEWIWLKSRTTGFLDSKRKPMKCHEQILVFYKNQPIYNIELKDLVSPIKSFRKNGKTGSLLGKTKQLLGVLQAKTGFPISVMAFQNDHNVGLLTHPTQKPVPLLEYLIKTYTNEGDMVLDNTMGSGSTGVACKNLNRKFIGIEKEPKYFEIAKQRIENTEAQLCL